MALLTHHGFPARSVELVKTLDIDGMSSEESEGEMGTPRTYRIKTLPWRSSAFTNWLHRVDDLPMKNKWNAIIRREDFRRRLPSDAVSDRRPPVERLPINLYSESWYKEKNTRFVKRLMASPTYPLPKIDEYSPKRR
jgi:hypothetical protein